MKTHDDNNYDNRLEHTENSNKSSYKSTNKNINENTNEDINEGIAENLTKNTENTANQQYTQRPNTQPHSYAKKMTDYQKKIFPFSTSPSTEESGKAPTQKVSYDQQVSTAPPTAASLGEENLESSKENSQGMPPSYTQSPNHTYPPYSNHTGGQKPPVEKPAKRKNGFVRFLAVMLAVVIAAGAGSGITYYLLRDQISDSSVLEGENSAPTEEVPDNSLQSSSLTTPHSNITQVAEKVIPMVVEVTTESVTTNPFFGELISGGAGSGVIISEDGYIVTNNHVVENATSIQVTTHDGEEYPAELVGRDHETDLAVLKIDGKDLATVTFANSDDLKVGDLAIAVGNPLGTLGGTVTDGIISALNREITIDDQTMNLIQTSAAVNQGNSGGGLFNANGELVGVVNAKSSGSGIEGLAFAIPSNLAKEVIAEIIDVGYVSGRPQLGISVIEVENEQMLRRYGLEETGVYVAESTRDNGLEPGDLIVAMDGVDIETFEDIQEILAEKKAKDTVLVAIKREGIPQEVEVELAEKVPEYVNTPEASNAAA